VTDFRAQRSPTPEGNGNAAGRWRLAWEAYGRAANRIAGPVLRPVVEPVALVIAGRVVEDLVGFWLLWQLEGGFEGLQKLGMSRSAVYRRIASFRKHFHEHPDDYVFPGVSLDVEAYLLATRSKRDTPASS